MEFVWVVKREELFDLSFPHGFVPSAANEEVARYLDRIRDRGFFLERRRAEVDSSFKQIIPYAVVVTPEGTLLLERLATQTEARLHRKLSIGVGGHINPVDGAEDVLDAGLSREIDEELEIAASWRGEPIGIINDETNDVGAVHFGIVYRIETTGPVTVRESDKMLGRLVPREELDRLQAEENARFETWSSLILQRADLALGNPAFA